MTHTATPAAAAAPTVEQINADRITEVLYLNNTSAVF